MCEPQLPIAVQVFLWRQLRPFIRAKLGRVHEASCVFCQHAPGHHEMKEACMSMERVLVQNIHNELTPSLKIVLETVPRWRLIQASFSFVLHATANLLNTKKDFQNLGPVETTFLYILHWIILDAAEECIDQDRDFKNPFYYLFSIPSVTLFVYLFIPLCSHLKDIDFKNNLRLENGQKIWYPIYEYHHPEVPCFTALCRSKSQPLWRTMVKTVQRQNFLDKVFLGSAEDLQSQNINATFCDHYTSINRTLDDNNSWVTSPKDKVFPETIPEESSSTEDEHVVIFTLPSLEDSGRILDGVKEVSTIFAGEASIFHVALGHGSNSSKSTLTIEQVTGVSDFETQNQYIREKFRANNRSIATERKDEKLKIIEQQMDSRDLKKQRYVSSYNKQTYISVLNMDLQAATFFDVAVIKCLFTSQWQEEGVFWALQFLYNRLRKINENVPMQQIPRERSHSLPIPKIEISIYENSDSKQKYGEKEDMEEQDTQSIAGLTLCKDLVCEDQNTETNYIRQINGKSKRRMKIADLKAFVETKLLSKSEKALEKIGEEFSKSLLDQF